MSHCCRNCNTQSVYCRRLNASCRGRGYDRWFAAGAGTAGKHTRRSTWSRSLSPWLMKHSTKGRKAVRAGDRKRTCDAAHSAIFHRKFIAPENRPRVSRNLKAVNIPHFPPILHGRILKVVMRSQTPLRFAHRLSKKAGLDSVCPRCFVTVAWSQSEPDLGRFEKEHVCDRSLLERVSRILHRRFAVH